MLSETALNDSNFTSQVMTYLSSDSYICGDNFSRYSACDASMVYRKIEFLFKSGNWRNQDIASGVSERNASNAKTLIFGHSDKSLSNANLRKLFRSGYERVAGTNLVARPKVTTIPLGLPNSFLDSELHQIFGNVSLIQEALQTGGSSETFTNTVYANFSTHTYRTRAKLARKLKSIGIDFVESEHSLLGRQEFCRNVVAANYVICPRGNGIDTHRFWESMFLGTIPIVKKDSRLSVFAMKFPCLELESWDQLSNAQFLEEQYYKLRAKKWDPRLLGVEHWLETAAVQ